MRVAVYYNNSDIRLEDRGVPKIGTGEVLVQVVSSGICGTDAMEWYRTKKGPRVLGHEIAGNIAESKTDKYKVGQRVFVSHHVPCGECKFCLQGNQTACEVLHKGNYDPGGYSEFIRVPRMNVEKGIYILPDEVSYDEGTMVEPLACAVGGQDAIGVGKKDVVLVLGSGVSGLLNIRLAKLKGAKVVATDVNEYRLNKAKEYGADDVIKAKDDICIKADKVIVCTGAYQAVEQAFNCVDRKGIILLFAIPDKDIVIPTADFWRNEITITSSYGAASSELKEALALIAKGKVDVKGMITHKLPLEKIQEGFRIVKEAGQSLKVVLAPRKGE